jgi:mannose-6-phosphate isomerase-like protein (cupin superfamily)
MKWSRRDLSLLAPALISAQTPARSEALPSSALRHEDVAARKSSALTSRQMMKGSTHSGYLVDLHESELAIGEAPHAPHRHLHEEMLLVREGLVEIDIAGRVTRLGPGSAAYMASNEVHGWRNIGATPARYFVLALGPDV